jgi:hypothetical protein
MPLQPGFQQKPDAFQTTWDAGLFAIAMVNI